MSAIWYPYAQMKTALPPLPVKSGKGAQLQLENSQTLIDGLSSWWCAIHGYSHPELIEAATHQLQTLSHVMQGGLTNEPAEALAKKLVEIAPNGLTKVFYADSGTIAMSLAMKMATQYWRNQGNTQKKHFVTVRRGYHGESADTMSLCDPQDGFLSGNDIKHYDKHSDYALDEHKSFAGLVPPQYFLPRLDFRFNATPEEIEPHIQTLKTFFEAKSYEVVAFVLEPVVQGAGGMLFYSPEYLKAARQLCDEYQVLLIFDEIATGFGRTGKLFASEYASATPDILALGKALFAGFLGHAAVMATDKVYNAFLSDDKSKCFMYGTTFQGNPTCCAVALKSIDIFERENYLQKIAAINQQLKEELLTFTHPNVKECRVLGAVGVIEVKDANLFKHTQEHVLKSGVWFRPFENIVYTTPPYIISKEELTQVTTALKSFVTIYS